MRLWGVGLHDSRLVPVPDNSKFTHTFKENDVTLTLNELILRIRVLRMRLKGMNNRLRGPSVKLIVM